jgi:hypothetical protein
MKRGSLFEAANFSRMGKLDPIESRTKIRKHACITLTSPVVACVVSNDYTIDFRIHINDYIRVSILAVQSIMAKVLWKTGPDPVNRYLIFQGGTSIRAGAVQPNGFDYYINLGTVPAIAADLNDYKISAIDNIFPVGSTVSMDKGLLPIEPEVLNILPVPYVLPDPASGFNVSGNLYTNDLSQTAGATVEYQLKMNFWLELER